MSPAAAFRRLVVIAATAGLASGVLESVLRVIRADANPDGIKLGAYLAWMPAAANGALFLVLAIGLVPIVWWRPAWATLPRLAGGFGALAAFNVVAVLTPPLAIYAVVILAVGVAAMLARAAAARPGSFERAGRWLAAPLLLGVAITAVGIEVARVLRERSALAATRPVAGAPNVLILLLDTVRAMNLSTYGYQERTSPSLTRLAATGIRFEEAYSTAPWTLPSHASLFTGRWPHELDADWERPLDATYPTLPEALTEAGYATGGFVANLIYTQRQAGIARGFAHYDDFLITPRQILLSSRIGHRLLKFWHERVRRLPGPISRRFHRKSATELQERLLRWVDDLEGRPFFAFVNYFDAHSDYFAPVGFPDPPRVPVPAQGTLTRWAPFAPKTNIAKYDKAIAYIDWELGRLFDELERRGVLDNTIVIVTADHGEAFREHGQAGHGNDLYVPALRIPLLVRYPARVPAGQVIAAPVSLRDVAATVLDLTGVANIRRLAGRSLARHWTTDSAPPDTLLAEINKSIRRPDSYPVSKGDMKSAFAGGRHVILGGDGSVELFDLAADPWEQRNLASDTADIAALTARLRALPSPNRDPATPDPR